MLGRRSDGKQVKNISAVYRIIPCIMSERDDAMVYSSFDIDLRKIEEYIEEKAKKNINITILDIIYTAMVRLIAELPQLNRFIVNQRIYQRNKITISMVVKKNLTVEGIGLQTKLSFDGTETIFDVRDKIETCIAECKEDTNTNDIDKFATMLSKIPTSIIKIVVAIIKFLDKHGMLPKKLIEISPLHSSAFITNLGSIGLDAIYHHIYNFGTISIFLAIGKKKKKENGERYITVKFVNDERICDGFYFAKSFRLFNKLLKHPELLEKKYDVKDEVK